MSQASNKKRFCVIGLSQFGYQLAVALAKNCEVLGIDCKQSTVNNIADYIDRALCFDVKDFSNLNAVVGPDFDEAVVCMGKSMEASILAVLHLKKIGIEKIHAKASNDDHAQILRSVGADNVIFPERDTAVRFATHVGNDNLLDFIPLSDGFSVVQVAPPEWFYGKSLIELNVRKRYGLFVLAVKEYVPPRTVFLPGPEFVIKDSDALLVVGREEDINKFTSEK
jgi:trk system potassium uptake protein TrkA